MENLAQLLDKLLETLGALATVLAEEQVLLCSHPLASVALQRVTDTKNQLLNTISWLEKQRAALEHSHHFLAPYPQQPSLASRWQQIQQQALQLREQNQHNGLLLNHHLAHNTQALSILHQQPPSLYGPDGHSCTHHLLGRKIRI
ncbi:flagellar biosynthesis protein FlgN [Chania multitudinisentens RB-25]|uniref:Flagellar biosynthesis protein FlgN n=1 Tax=Chania multitudinisentens RB-25 TaxID=1441930 RepID=W0LJ70_9GAMM|nr:flagellar export chaperone FlgN [Chania multitudinisentens]AHG22040.1 flagellar biosynthesis protein FlgN [Chania multitudinisentens RB-25]